MVQTGPGYSFFLLTIGGGACDPQGQWAGVLLGKESVCLLRTVSEEEAVPLSRRASRGLAGSHLALTTPLEALGRWPAGSLVLRLSRCLPRPGASLSPHFLLFWAVNTFVLT